VPGSVGGNGRVVPGLAKAAEAVAITANPREKRAKFSEMVVIQVVSVYKIWYLASKE
jgi:hypothetical protein